MQPPRQHSRINLAELKAQIVKKIGPEGSKQYFYYLSSFLSLKLTKVEFNKLCHRIIGRENIPLHNQLIRSILRNACSAKTPPPLNQKDEPLKHITQVSTKDISIENNGSHTNTTLASGDMLPISPRKARSTALRDRRRSALAPQMSAGGPQSSDFNVLLENGDLNKSRILISQTDKFPSLRRSQEDGKESYAKCPLRAPLGVPLCPVTIGGARRAPPSVSVSSIGGARFSTLESGILLDSLMLRERMERIALSQGLEGVSLDSANVLNHGLDAYIKGLLRSCIDLVGSRSGHELRKNHDYGKLVNGVKPGHQYQMQEQRTHCPISLRDFRVAMELNPQKLGEDWPLLLEKICTLAFEE